MDHMHFYRNTLFYQFAIFMASPFWLKALGNNDQILSFKVTRYNDVEVTVPAHTLDTEKFEEQLINLLGMWKEQKIKAAMLAIPTAYLPVALKHGFKIHHATPEKIVLCASVSAPEMLIHFQKQFYQ